MSECRLHDGSTVAIIGGGPGGAACAKSANGFDRGKYVNLVKRLDEEQ